MIAGGSEAAITPMGVGGFAAMRALSTRNDEPQHASRPFDRDRDGFVMGEGAGVVILEELELAQAPRRADLRRAGRLRHVGRRVPHHRAVRGRRRRHARDAAGAGATPASRRRRSTTSTRTARRRRSTTSSRRWPSSASSASTPARLAISSTKSMTGHLLGAAGGLEAGIAALAIKHQLIPPTINYEYPDPECDLDYVPNQTREAAIEYALSNSFGFGGTNGALLFKKFDGWSQLPSSRLPACARQWYGVNGSSRHVGQRSSRSHVRRALTFEAGNAGSWQLDSEHP